VTPGTRKILTSALGLPESATEDQMAHKLADVLMQPASVPTTMQIDDPEASFHQLAEKLSRATGISLADAYSRISQEAPDLYLRAAVGRSAVDRRPGQGTEPPSSPRSESRPHARAGHGQGEGRQRVRSDGAGRSGGRR
jgi:hypothetical protein